MESFENIHLNENHCFLCGIHLDNSNRSDEHVFPEWLLRKHDLWNQNLVLLNHTSIPYRKILIPCCKNCNNGPLAQMESKVSQLLSGKFREPSENEEYMLFQWCSKILYGLLHREMMLLYDRSIGSDERIVNKEFLENFSTFHHFMTSIRRPFRFIEFKPYSIFIMETLTFSNPFRNFDYYDFIAIDSLDGPTGVFSLAIRTHNFGIICIFQDNGFQKKHFQKLFDRFKYIPLHPIQFLELACKSSYKHSLLSFSPKYHSIAHDDPDSEVTVIQASYPVGQIWLPWDDTTYANIFYSLANRSGFSVPHPDEFYVDGKHHTWLDDGFGNPPIITEDDEQFI